jgi:hypothetical protein
VSQYLITCALILKREEPSNIPYFCVTSSWFNIAKQLHFKLSTLPNLYLKMKFKMQDNASVPKIIH